MKTKKKTFVLLEILIAFSLVSITILPFFRFPYQHVKKQLDLIFEMELESHARKELADLEIALINKEIPPSYLFGEKPVKEILNPDEDYITVTLASGITRKYKKELFVQCVYQKLSTDRTMWALVKLEVKYLKPKGRRKIVFDAFTKVVARKKI